MATDNVTSSRLRELLSYDAHSGVFVLLAQRGPAKAGSVAGSFKDGYKEVMLDGRSYLAHRLAWFYMTGTWPTGQIDHINGDRSDNRISNLRDASPSVNQQNRRAAQCNSRSGLLGVTHYKRDDKWMASIRVNRKQHNLGLFATPELAHAAYIEAKRKMHDGCTL